MTTISLDQFWRCLTCGAGLALGPPATFTAPPTCGAHGEMQQVTAEGYKADLDALRRETEGNQP